MNIFDRYKATQWLQKELDDQDITPSLVDRLQETWHTIDTLHEYLLPETVISLLLARTPQSTEKMTVQLHLNMDEFFALYGAIKAYDAELRQGDQSEMNKIALEAVQRLHQRILTATVQPPPAEEEV